MKTKNIIYIILGIFIIVLILYLIIHLTSIPYEKGSTGYFVKKYHHTGCRIVFYNGPSYNSKINLIKNLDICIYLLEGCYYTNEQFCSISGLYNEKIFNINFDYIKNDILMGDLDRCSKDVSDCGQELDECNKQKGDLNNQITALTINNHIILDRFDGLISDLSLCQNKYETCLSSCGKE